MSDTVAERAPRGSVSLYIVAFVLLLGSAVAVTFASKGLLASTKLLWTSIALSVLAMAAAAGAAMRRR